MIQIVILSGKGGTGKTSITAAFAHLAKSTSSPMRSVLADADVDAANLEFVLAPSTLEANEFLGGQVAVIDKDICGGCGTCESVCRFGAVYEAGDIYQIDTLACEGCAACMFQCPREAIRMEEQIAGQWFASQTIYGPMFHAALKPAQENSGKLVTMVKQQAKLLALDEAYDLVLVDGPPGIGCPVISAVSGADLTLIVAEPTASGIHDLRRILETTKHFGVPAIVCINKADIYSDGAALIEDFCQEEGIQVIGKIPFDTTVTEAMVQGQPVTAYCQEAPASQALGTIWTKILEKMKDAK
jgi:MinD superfamily P-loop ATPase